MNWTLDNRDGAWVLVDATSPGSRPATDAEIAFWERIAELEDARNAAIKSLCDMTGLEGFVADLREQRKVADELHTKRARQLEEAEEHLRRWSAKQSRILEQRDKRIAELEEELRVANLMTGAFERMKLATDELKAAQQRIAALEAVLRLLRHHRLTAEGGLPADLLERESALIGYVSDDDARAFGEGT